MRINLFLLSLCFFCMNNLGAEDNLNPFAPLGDTVPDYVNKYYDETGRLVFFPDWLEDESSKNIDEENLKKLSGDIVLYKYSYMSAPGFNYCPSPEEIINNVSVSLSPDEYEPLTFGVFGLRNTEGVEWDISNFHSKDGAVLDKKFVDVRILRGVPNATVIWDEWVNKTRKKTEQIYKRVPLVLEKRNPFILPMHETRHFWVTVYAPGDTVPGIYSGHIGLKGAGWRRELPVEINILPVKLEAPAKIFNIMLQPDKRAQGFYFKKNLPKHLADIKAHGLNSICCDLAPEFVYDRNGEAVDINMYGMTKDNGTSPYDNLIEFLELYQKTGFNGPLINCFRCFMGYHQYLPKRNQKRVDIFAETNVLLMNKFIKQFIELADAKNIKVGFEIGDEPANTDIETKKVSAFLPLLRRNFKEITLLTFINGMWKGINEIEKFSSNSPDIYVSNYVNQELLDSARKYSKNLWVYCNARNPAASRYFSGFYSWALDCGGVLTWVYQTDFSYKKDTYINFDGFNGHPFSGSMTAPSEKGPLPMPGWEAYREGIDDQRYICALELLVSRIKKDSSDKLLLDEAEKASRLLEMIKKECFSNLICDVSPEWLSPLRFKNYRKAIISMIIRLQELCDHKVPKDTKPGSKFDLKVRDIRQTPKMGKELFPPDNSIYVAEIPGEISENTWEKASAIDNFRMIGSGVGASETSRIKILFSRERLLIRFECNDAEPEQIVADGARKKDQEVWKDDCIEIFLLKRLGTADVQGAHFSLNAGNVAGDALIDTSKYKFEKSDWDAKWEHSANLTKNGWQAEMIIPFSILGVDGKSPGEFKFLAGRHIKRKNENSSFPGVENKFFEPEKMAALFCLPAKPLVLLSDKLHAVSGASKIIVQLFNNMDKEFTGSIAVTGGIPSLIKIAPHSARTVAVAVNPLSAGISDIPLNVFDEGGILVLDSVIKCSTVPEIEEVCIDSDIVFAGDTIDIGVKNIFSASANIGSRIRISNKNGIVLERTLSFPWRGDFTFPMSLLPFDAYIMDFCILKDGATVCEKKFPLILFAE